MCLPAVGNGPPAGRVGGWEGFSRGLSGSVTGQCRRGSCAVYRGADWRGAEMRCVEVVCAGLGIGGGALS